MNLDMIHGNKYNKEKQKLKQRNYKSSNDIILY